MSAECRDLAVYLFKRIKADPKLAYLIGPYTQTWALLSEALASITGETPEIARKRMNEELSAVQKGERA